MPLLVALLISLALFFFANYFIGFWIGLMISIVVFAPNVSPYDLDWRLKFGLTDMSFSKGLSSAGRAPDLHSGGQEFDPPRLHHPKPAFAQPKFLIQWIKNRVRMPRQGQIARDAVGSVSVLSLSFTKIREKNGFPSR